MNVVNRAILMMLVSQCVIHHQLMGIKKVMTYKQIIIKELIIVDEKDLYERK